MHHEQKKRPSVVQKQTLHPDVNPKPAHQSPPHPAHILQTYRQTPDTVNWKDTLQFQKTLGNAAVCQLLAARGNTGGTTAKAPIQAKGKSKSWKKRRRMRLAHEASLRQREKELQSIRAMKIVSGPAGQENPIPGKKNTQQAPKKASKKAPKTNPSDALKYKDIMARSSEFLHPDHPVRSVFNDGGPQFIQEIHENQARETRRVGIDVEPGSGHVEQLGPHLNLQTQINGKISKEHPDPHLPVYKANPFPEGHSAHAINAEERRKFMERYMISTGLQIKRPDKPAKKI